MSSTHDAVLDAPWVADLSAYVAVRLGYRIPSHRMIREVAPFTVAEAALRGLPGPAALVDALRRGEGAESWERLVDLATIGETHFFRHPDQLEALTALARRRRAALGRPLQVWSAGCASGEEAWSVLIRFEDAGIPVEVTASDVSPKALARARAGGPYSDRSVGHLPERHRLRWLRREGRFSWWLERPESLAVRFARHNLVQDPPLRPRHGAWDVILCRNVLLYFTQDAGRSVIERLGACLGDGGSLWVAPADPVRTAGDALAWHREGAQRYLGPVRPGDEVSSAIEARPRPAAAPPGQSEAVPKSTGSWVDELAVCIARGLPVAAATVVSRRLRARPDDGAAWVASAALHLHAHDFTEALDALERARQVHPSPEGLAYLRGTALLKAGRPADALVSFLQAVEDDPDDWASSWQASDLYRRQGRTLLEELMLRRTAQLLATGLAPSPSFGPAAGLVNSVHRDPLAVRRLVAERLASLAAATDRGAGRENP